MMLSVNYKLTLIIMSLMALFFSSHGQNNESLKADVFHQSDVFSISKLEILKELKERVRLDEHQPNIKMASEVLQKMDKLEYTQTNYSFVFDRYGSISLNIEKSEEVSEDMWLIKNAHLVGVTSKETR